MKIKILLLFGLLVLVASCNTSSVYKKDYEFDKNQWQKSDAKTFDFTIDDDAKLYDITFSLSHVFDYQFASIPLSFKWIKPDGTSDVISIDLKMKDENGKELGECAIDVCDLKHIIDSKVKLQKGKHQIIVSHTFDYDYLPNIIHIGLEVIKLK